jgi:hypothetical protein
VNRKSTSSSYNVGDNVKSCFWPIAEGRHRLKSTRRSRSTNPVRPRGKHGEAPQYAKHFIDL